MNRLDGKVAVITGGTSGMGEASAKRFAEAGASVVIAGRNEQRGKAVEAEIRENGGDAAYIHLDVSKENEVEGVIRNVIEKYRKIDILFNNAGIFPVTSSLEQMETTVWDEIMDINSNGTFIITKYSMPYL